jgi:CheY-like chemotaxis protein
MSNLKSLKEKINHLKILVVDDNLPVLESTLLFFNKFAQSDGAKNGKEALELYEKNGGYDIVVSDAKMPGMSGWTLLQKIRQIDPHAFIGIMSGYGIEDDTDRTLCDFFLDKPVSIDGLVEMFEKYLKQGSGT